MARKIGSLTPLWNQELFIKPHFAMLEKLDRNLVLIEAGPLPNYHKEHGYSVKKDLSEELIKRFFPKVEVKPGYYPTTLEFGAGLYNEGLLQMQDCDIVLRLDPDMIWKQEDFDRFIDLIRNTDYDCYRMDFHRNSINYYITGDFDHGLKDAYELDALAVNPKHLFTGVLDYPDHNTKVIDLSDWMCHHFRGWNKPKSTPPNWATDIVSQEYVLDNGGWVSCPPDIRKTMEEWMQELKEIKDEK